jgi:hypothetical protein
MSQVVFYGSGGSGGTPIETIDGNTGFVAGSTINLITPVTEKTLMFNGNDSFTMTLNTTDTVGNVSLGLGAFINGAAGSERNTVLGSLAGGNLTTGTDNVIIGTGAAVAYTGAESDNIVIGSTNSNPGYAGDMGAIRIGTSAFQTTCFIAGIDGVNVGSVATVVTEASNQLGTAVITAGSGITVTPGANTITIAATGGGGGITTIDGNVGSVTGATVTIESTGEGTAFTNATSATNLNLLFTDANSNVGIGTSALGLLSGGYENVMVGSIAGAAYTTGTAARNTGLGWATLNADQTGYWNTAIGAAAGSNLNGGNFNVLIGPGAGTGYNSTEQYNIVLGNVAGTGGESGAIHIGDAGNNTTFYAGGINGVNVGSVATVVTGAATAGGIQLGTAVITAGTGITVTPGANTITIDSTATGTVTTLTGDSGTASPSAGNINIVVGNQGTALIQGSSNTLGLFFRGGAVSTNLSIGSVSLISATGGSNTSFGSGLNSVTSGSGNTAIGAGVLSSVTTGSNNNGMGLDVGGLISSGNYNIFIGTNAGTAYVTGTESSNILFNANGTNGENNVLRIGNATGTSTQQLNSAYICGITGINVTGSAVMVNASNQLGVTVSSARYKENIQDLGDTSSSIMKLRPVKFNYKSDPTPQTGLIAEEVDKINPQLVVYDQEGLPQTVKYHDLPALLLNEIQKLRKEVDELKRIKG